LGRAARLVVLVSGSGTLLQALIDACADPAYGAQIVAVGSDRPDVQGLTRAEQAQIPTFVLALPNYPSRAEWDQALTAEVAAYQPDLVISAGFMKLLGAEFLDRFEGRIINTHPALLPSFPACTVHEMPWRMASRSLSHGVFGGFRSGQRCDPRSTGSAGCRG
jgi:phosphoribosylglycinamide formyltransferase-1